MKKYILYINFTLLIVLIFFLFGFASQRNLHKGVKDIDIVFKNGENLFISYETVNKLLIQNFDLNNIQSKENLNLNNVEDFLQSNNMVEKAEIFLSINGELGAIITQRTPILRVANSEGSYYYDKYGDKMPLSDKYSARVPITVDELNKHNKKDMICFANMIKYDQFLRKEIIGIHQVEKEGSYQFELKTRLGNQKIIFGELKRIDEKVSKLKAFYQKSISDKTLNNYKTINLKFNDQVVCEKI